MPDEQTPDAGYIKGFNEGYIITKHLPQLSDQLSKIKNETPRIDGFKDGRNEFFQEKAKERMGKFLHKDNTGRPGKTVTPDKYKKGKEDFDKDIL